MALKSSDPEAVVAANEIFEQYAVPSEIIDDIDDHILFFRKLLQSFQPNLGQLEATEAVKRSFEEEEVIRDCLKKYLSDLKISQEGQEALFAPLWDIIQYDS